MVGQGIARPPVAIGFSNGPIMAAALLLTSFEAAGGCDPVPAFVTVRG
jgi:predicted esterase